MPDQILVERRPLRIPSTELHTAAAGLQRLGLLTDAAPDRNREQAILAGVHKLGVQFGYASDQLTDHSIISALIAFLTHRFCGTPDTPAQTSGIHVLTYGTPIGTWTRGNLTVNINPAGVKGLSPAQASNIIFSAYQQYQAAQPFFSFTPGGAGSNINVQFGGTNLNPTLGQPGGPIGIGFAPPSGNLYFDSGTTWTPAFLLAVALHEAGHTLGLSHSTNSASVMYPFAPTLNALDPETIEAIQSLYGWLPQVRLGDRASTDGPSLAFVMEPSFTGTGFQQMFMAWTGSKGDSGLYFASSGDGINWTPQQKIPNVGSSNGPSLTTFHPPSRDGFPAVGLFMAWKGVGDDHNIYWSSNTSLDVQGFTPQQSIPVGTSARPAVIEFNNQMVLAWKGVPGDSGIYWSKLGANGQWSPQQQIAGRGTSGAPALVVYNLQLHMYWKGIDGDSNVYHAILIDPANGIWGPQDKVFFVDAGNLNSGETPIDIGTSAGPSATVRGGELVLAWKGVPGDHALWFSRFQNGAYSGQISVPNVGSEAGPTIANLNGRLVLAWRGINDDRNLYVSTLG
ncbi:matrixin family metalloprotease [Methylocapsa palsarum]|uniref:Matrixin n=1 Tax=Methylocapsa palsarum TaxID=1612308 RepID=A0A1I4D1S9_9HYPH|nr:matrixin family metalloprotease [Methylocapsa palsarum]SFK86810.1 Matrixin [Methylocapsa palsarum]